MPFNVKTKNAFEMTARPAAAELTSHQVGRKAFIAVYPPSPVGSGGPWRVRRFEIPESLTDKYPAEEDLIGSTLIALNNLEDVEQLLTSWEVDSSTLDAPWKCDYPL